MIIYDRHALDTLADLMVGTKRFDLHEKTIGKQFIRLLPNNVNIITLVVEEEIIRNRKIDTLYDINLSNKIKVYQILRNDLEIDFVNNNHNDQTTVFEIIKSKLHLTDF